MTLPVVNKRHVARDLASARVWYEEQEAGLGDALLAAVGGTIDAIERFPMMFAPVRGEVRRAIVARFPSSVFYLVEPARVVVLAVLHIARNPDVWPCSPGKP